MKLLTFLGTGAYKEATYVWGDKEHVKTAFFASALAQWLQPEEILVCLTTEVEKHENWQGLQKALEGRILRPIHIPSGKSEAELWDIFDAMTAHLQKNTQLTIDITHAFRSIPMLALVVSAYLTRARNVQIQHIVYGAYEARDEKGDSPVFDVTSFLTLLDWMNATDQFLQTGDARRMAKLLEDRNSSLWRSNAEAVTEGLPRKLERLSKSLHHLSQALLTSRVQEIPKFAKKIPSRLTEAETEARQWVQPLNVLLHRIRSEYDSFQTDTLHSQFQLIEWYLENGHVMQAIVLAREWLVNWACGRLKKHFISDRQIVEKAIGNASRLNQGKPVSEPTDFDESLKKERDLIEAWDFVSDLRNDVAHCGFREKPTRSESIYQNAQAIPNKLTNLLSMIDDSTP